MIILRGFLLVSIGFAPLILGSLAFSSLLPASSLYDDRYVDVNIWSRHNSVVKSFFKGDGAGHASLTIRDKNPATGGERCIYASLWPKDKITSLDAIDLLWHLPSDDERAERRPPDQIIRIYSLNSKDMYNDFDNVIKRGVMKYKLTEALPGASSTECSCASWAVRLLQGGGAKELFPKDDSILGTLKVVGKKAFGTVLMTAGTGTVLGGPPGGFVGALIGVGAVFRGLERGFSEVEDGHEAFSFHHVTPNDVLDLVRKFRDLEVSNFSGTRGWVRDVTSQWNTSSGSFLDNISTSMKSQYISPSLGRTNWGDL